jgi:hypothetical protein
MGWTTFWAIFFKQAHLVTLFQAKQIQLFRGPCKSAPEQGCQMLYLHTKYSNLGIFWRALGTMKNVGIFYGLLEYFIDI